MYGRTPVWWGTVRGPDIMPFIMLWENLQPAGYAPKGLRCVSSSLREVKKRCLAGSPPARTARAGNWAYRRRGSKAAYQAQCWIPLYSQAQQE